LPTDGHGPAGARAPILLAPCRPRVPRSLRAEGGELVTWNADGAAEADGLDGAGLDGGVDGFDV